MKIAVLCGGISTEREISLRTSAKVANALQEKGHEVVMIDVFLGADEVPDFSTAKDFFSIADSIRNRNSEITKEKIRRYPA